ncbi:MAG: ImuA family protein [Micropepsaceae bacterium]
MTRLIPQSSAEITFATDKIFASCASTGQKRAERSRSEGTNALRETIAAIEAACLRKADPRARPPVATGVAEIDATLNGGLMRGTIHELMPKAVPDIATAAGFAFALAARAETPAAHTLYIQHDFTAAEFGRPYLPGLGLTGIDTRALVYLNVPRAEDVLWAMAEALKCRGFAAVIAEFPPATRVLDLTMTRRLALAAQEGGALGLILRHASGIEPNAATTRWRIASAPSTPDAFGGLGAPTFQLDLVKNRFGQCGQWRVEWLSHERTFAIPLSRRLARPFADGSDRTWQLTKTA